LKKQQQSSVGTSAVPARTSTKYLPKNVYGVFAARMLVRAVHEFQLLVDTAHLHNYLTVGVSTQQRPFLKAL
jgi:hypothetical protein